MKLRIALVLLVCLGLSILESTVPFLLHLKATRADLLLSVVLYLALHDEVVQGAALSLCVGYLSDLTSAAPTCLYTLLAVLTFVVVRLAGSAIKTDGGFQSAALTFAASLVHSSVAAMLFQFVAPTSEGLVLKMSPLFWSALGTAVAAPAVFSVLRRLDKKLLPVEGTTLVR
ncbi:MAG TPA: rod shape-determining protein MreD [Myxococcales bacterium]|jgi:rod shape-determining protein MreD|nr:rod shape-determining protein MreD [Myxococcales bacterium]